MRTITPLETWKAWEEGGHAEEKRAAVSAVLEEGSNPRVLLITGENAGGKSLVVSILRRMSIELASEDGGKLEVMDIGMNRRVAAGMERAMIFGHEASDSTGNVSIRTAIKGIEQSRLRDNPHWLILDEPDIGVGEGYHLAIGQYLADFSQTLHPSCMGFVLVTHSRTIARELVNTGASSLRVGNDLRPVREWIVQGDIPKSIEDLLSLPERTRKKKTVVSRLMETLREERRERAGETGPRLF